MSKKLLAILTALSMVLICLVGCGGNKEEEKNLFESLDNTLYDAYMSTDLKTKDMKDVAANPEKYVGKTVSFLSVPIESNEDESITKVAVAAPNPDPEKYFEFQKSDINISITYDENRVFLQDLGENSSIGYALLGIITEVNDDGLPVVDVCGFCNGTEYVDIVALASVFKDNPEELKDLEIELPGIGFMALNKDPEDIDANELEAEKKEALDLGRKIAEKEQNKEENNLYSYGSSYIDKNGDYWFVIKNNSNYVKSSMKKFLSDSSTKVAPLSEVAVYFLPKDKAESLEYETKIDAVDTIPLVFE